MDLYLDISASIYRTRTSHDQLMMERELGGRIDWQDPTPPRFCFFHAGEQRFWELKSDGARRFLAGHLTADASALDQIVWPQDPSRTFDVLRTAAQTRFLLSRPDRGRASSALSRMLESKSAAEVLAIRNALEPFPALEQRACVWLDDLVEGPAILDAESYVVSLGANHFTTDMRALRLQKAKYGFRYAAAVGSLTALTNPHLASPEHLDEETRFLGELIWAADLLLVPSDATRLEIEAFARLWRQSPPVIHVSPPGHTEAARSNLPPHGLENYFVQEVRPADTESVSLILSAMETLRCTAPLQPLLVLALRDHTFSPCLAHQIRHNPALKGRVKLMTNVPSETMARLYDHARFALFPSTLPSFGVELVEAIGRGKACVVSDLPTNRQWAGTGALYIEPKSPEAWAQAISRLVTTPSELTLLEGRSREQTPLSWAQAARLLGERLLSWATQA